MSTQVFPSLIGLTWNRSRTPEWDTILQEAVAGGETRIALRQYPKWQWKLNYSFLGSGFISNNDFFTLAGFYNARNGMFDSFLLTEPDDSSVTGQQIGTGNGTNLIFPLLRTLGGFIEPVLAPNAVATVYVNGSPVLNTTYSVSTWSAAVSNGGSGAPGVITFGAGHAPPNGQAVAVDMTYYWPVRFDSDSYDFDNIMNKIWALKEITLKQVYN